MSPDQQRAFVATLRAEIARLQAWCVDQGWLPDEFPALQVFVSDEFRISRALIPAALGQRGRMEFPAWKVVAGEAAVMHEIVHVFFPNGNRLLAEGFAIFLQAQIGGNPAFPNFGRPLHKAAIVALRSMAPGLANGDRASLDAVRIAMLDRIATPSGLRLRVGTKIYQIDEVGLAHLYPLAGSFVAFVIEKHGLERFRALYQRTPLKPFERDAGSPERWTEVYGAPFEEIERGWKAGLLSSRGMSFSP